MSHKKNAKHITKITATRPSEKTAEKPEVTLEPTTPETPHINANNQAAETAHTSADTNISDTQPTSDPTLSKKEAKLAKKSAKLAKKQAKKSKNSKDTPEKPLKEIFILARPFVGIGRYFRDSWRELRQVRWPNRKATWKMTLAVLVYCAIFMVFILLLDMLFSFIFNLLISK